MSFDDIERSNYSGKPLVLYEFTLGETVWHYCGGQSDLTFNGVLYKAIAVSYAEYSMSGDPDSDDLSINISTKAAVTDLFNGTPPSDPIQVAIRTLHSGDTEAPVVWSGTVKSGRRVSRAEFIFNCNSLLSTLKRNGLRLFWQRGCQHALYDRLCRVNPDDHDTLAQVSAMTGASLTVSGIAALGDGYFSGGYLSFLSPYGTTDRRAIERHVGNVLHLLGATDGIEVGSWITVLPGCNRTTPVCLNKFNNLDNYGGFPHMPDKSPFDGDPIF